MGAKLALFGGVLWAFLALSKRSKENADRQALEIFTKQELSRPAPGSDPSPEPGASAADESRRERRWQAGHLLPTQIALMKWLRIKGLLDVSSNSDSGGNSFCSPGRTRAMAGGTDAGHRSPLKLFTGVMIV